jgi:hypothetical protein
MWISVELVCGIKPLEDANTGDKGLSAAETIFSRTYQKT